MCLSPQVDLAVGIVLTGIAVDSIRHSKHSRTLPLALLPAVFAVHSFSSAVVWWGEKNLVSHTVAHASSLFYIFIAFVLLPIFVPLAVLLIEPRGWRRTALFVLSGCGLVAGMQSMFYLMDGTGYAIKETNSLIEYHVSGTPSSTGVLYVLATCGAMLLSGQRILVQWGFVNAFAIAALELRARDGLPSLWCLWAAATSGFIVWFLRRIESEHKSGALWPWETSD